MATYNQSWENRKKAQAAAKKKAPAKKAPAKKGKK